MSSYEPMPADTSAPPGPSNIEPSAVIAETASLYGRYASILLPAAAVIYAVEAVFVYALGSALAAVGGVIAIVAGVFYQGMVVQLVRDVQDGRRDSSIGDLFGSVAPVVLPLIGVSLLLALGVAIGFILLVVPGLYLLTVWSVVAPVTVLERPGVLAAFGRSRELVRGNGWRVFAVILIIFAAAIVAGVAAVAITSGASQSTRVFVQFILDVLVAPISALLTATLYFALLRARGDSAASSSRA